MSRRLAIGLVVVCVLGNAAATMLYCGSGPNAPTAAAPASTWYAVLRMIADALTVPLSTSGITDVRDVALIAALGVALLLLAGESADVVRAWPSDPSSQHRSRRFFWNPTGWIAVAAAAVVVAAVLSAAVNHTADLSWGWIVRFIAGAVWAALIAGWFTERMVRHTLAALLVLAAVAMLLAIADRAERGVVLFRWPIGPITVTAALAAVWASLSGTWAAARIVSRRFDRGTILLALVAILSLYVLHQSGRRAPVLGFLAAVLAAGALWVVARYHRRVVRAGIVGAFIVAVVGAICYVGTQLRSADRESAGSVGLRLEYWRLSGGLIARHPLLGSGPDTFVVEMTNAVAPLRAESPHFFHGNLEMYAHNEWIQAAVELGLPAAAVYTAMPIILLAFAGRRLRVLLTHTSEGAGDAGPAATETVAMMLTLCAALAAIIVTECGSITLRTPMMPMWYWTLLGLLAALSHAKSMATSSVVPADSQPRKPRGADKRFSSLVCAVACFAFVVTDLSRSVSEARGKAGLMEGQFTSRLYADRTLMARYDAAVSALRDALGGDRPMRLNLAWILSWPLYDIMPSLAEVPAVYARALILYGHEDEARTVLADALAHVNQYDPATNTLYAQVLADDPIERLRCAQRALRAGALDADLQKLLVELAGQPTAMGCLAGELPQARAIAAAPPATRPRAEVSAPIVELLRIDAFLKERAGQKEQAIAEQRLAAAFYQRLERDQNRYRRAHDAEIDAFFTLARLLYEADPANYAAAYDAIVEAERYAVLSLPHDRLARPQPEYGYVWGEVAPTEFPQRLFPLWRLSALLHLTAGQDQYLDARIFSYLPPERWTPAELDRQLAGLAAQAYADLSRVPPEKRPPHYAALAGMARRHGTTLPTTPGDNPPASGRSEPRP